MKKTVLKELIKEQLLSSMKGRSLKENEEKPVVKEAGENVEGDEDGEHTGEFEDQIGPVFAVKKPTKGETPEQLVITSDILDISGKVQSGELSLDTMAGIYKTEGKALGVAKKLIKQQESELKEDIKTGSSQLKQLDEKIAEAKLEIQEKTTQALENPGQRSSVASDLDNLYKKLDKYAELKAKLEKALPKKEAKPKEEKKDNAKKDKSDK